MKLYPTILSTTLLLVFLSCEAHAGSNFSTLSQVTNVIRVKNEQEMQRINRIVEEAKEMSQEGLSKEELEKMKQHADEILRKADSTSSPLEFYKWILYELEKNVEERNLFYLDMALISDQVQRFGEDPEFFNKHDRNDLRIAVKDKDFVKARQLIKEAGNRMQPGAMVQVGSSTIMFWHP